VSEPDSFLAVARVVAAHGVQGEVRCEVLTDFPERFVRTKRLYGGADRHIIPIVRARQVRAGVLLKLEGVDTRNAAEQLRGMVLYVKDTDAVSLPADTYFWHQIVGLRVRTVDGQELGVIADILPTGSNDVYIVRGEGREILLPAIHDVVQNIDLDNELMTVELLEGLL
jgi:16S rRNA processing protein RimM